MAIPRKVSSVERGFVVAGVARLHDTEERGGESLARDLLHLAGLLDVPYRSEIKLRANGPTRRVRQLGGSAESVSKPTREPWPRASDAASSAPHAFISWPRGKAKKRAICLSWS